MVRMREVVLALMLFAMFSFVGCAMAAEEGEAMAWLKGPEAPKKVVAVFIETGTTPIDRNDKPREIIEAKIGEFLPPERFSIVPLDKSEQELMDYKEDHGIIVNEFFSGRAPREGIQEVCKKIGDVDYALLIYVSNDIPKGKVAMFGLGSSFKVKVACDVRLLDVETGQYVARDKAEDAGKRASIGKAFTDGLSKALDKIKLDTSMVELEQPE